MSRAVRWSMALAVLLTLLLGGPATAMPAEQDDPVLRVGTEGTYPPFTYRDPDTDELTGYDIEVIEAVAERAGWRLEFVETQFDAIFPALDAGRVDIIANQVSINPEREARYALSEPYTYSRGVIVTRSDDDSIQSLADLKGKTTAQSSTTNWAAIARDAGANVEAVEGFAQAAELLVQGRVDAIVNDNIAVLDYLATTGSDAVKIAADADQETSEQALVFRQDDAALRDEADRALNSLREDGTLSEISDSYFGADVSIEDGGEATTEGRGGRSMWDVLRAEAWPMTLALVKVTIPLTAASFVLGLILALGVALARISRTRWLSWPAGAFVSIIRGTPLLLQLFVVFYGLPQLGLTFDRFPAAVATFSLNVAGYAAEIIRSSILAVPRGQTEAARTIGLDYRQTLRRIILPQALRTAVPPLSNSLLSLVKDTSLASVLLVTDLFRVAQVAAGESNEFLALYAFAGLYYWIVCWLLSRAQHRLERRLDRYVT
ncbi:ABC transporter permease subunit [Aeromicrobium piscarium]|uniref:ABC transporter permease subunit n=1 Tax=Aeromicrobium piscarium TaxID=2590901 RepID=A0A554RNY0_9ACTN|nr:ABC transporter permease subunit [Aeromicrobium piscarium]TSD55819.1 ABC transporter permease subunit [Aeromicrobium piscarium]